MVPRDTFSPLILFRQKPLQSFRPAYMDHHRADLGSTKWGNFIKRNILWSKLTFISKNNFEMDSTREGSPLVI